MSRLLISTPRVVGVPREIKHQEGRVALTPSGAKYLVSQGVHVNVETCAGQGSGYTDGQYRQAGAHVLEREQVFAKSSLIAKVKEPQPSEYDSFWNGQVVFTYFHFAGCDGLEDAMKARNAICVPYETVQKEDGSLPLLTPMSEVAGRLAIQEGMRFLSKNNNGSGILLSGVPGVEPGKVVVIGGGVVGTNAATLAAGLGAKVVILDNNLERLRYLSQVMPPNVVTVCSSPDVIAEQLASADLAIGAVLVAGKEAPKLVTKEMITGMKKGSVFVDVAIDQGGICELSKPTTHQNPIINVGGVSLYCVANMPGVVPVTSTKALTNATLPYLLALAKRQENQYSELKKAIKDYR
jgi:alanine dehydrogenase